MESHTIAIVVGEDTKTLSVLNPPVISMDLQRGKDYWRVSPTQLRYRAKNTSKRSARRRDGEFVTSKATGSSGNADQKLVHATVPRRSQ